MHHISSLQNPVIKKILQLQDKSRFRKKEGLFVVEGQREFKLAEKSHYSIEHILIEPNLIDADLLKTIENRPQCSAISKTVYKKITYRSSTEGIVAIFKSKSHDINTIKWHSTAPLILVAEAPEKPGNIGALLRTADAAKVDLFILANPKTDLYNPNVIRSSVGCVFTTPIATGTTSNIITFLKQHKIDIYAATLQNSNLYTEEKYNGASAIVVGTEATGLSDDWREAAKQNIIIPMQGEIDSMNVSVAAGILIFEAKRQRGF